ncbi:DUF4296 domain-containing protein [bacterium]|nr:DUF4296 domain-containing protein [bacterium]
MYRITFYSVLLVLLSACGNSDPRIPSNVIPEEEMVDIIKDMQMLESMHKDIGLYGTEKRSISDTSYMIVFNKYEVKPSEFDSSLRFYTNNPKMMERIMEKVAGKLNQDL